jgi:RNA polymerase sigma factor (sigma-70 family)
VPRGPLQGVLDHLRRAGFREGAGDLTNAELLDRFVRGHDEAAFELLVWRHAALVLGTCRRLLRDPHEAEDAFQATFLVFIRKAGSIRKGEALGGWLHRVACCVARRARARAAKRACQSLPGDDLPDRPHADELLWRDLRPVLDEEVNRLPDKYRRPFVLCYLEGHTNEQAARELGCPRGTILSRLARGRERLRDRLARRGLTLSGSLVAVLLGQRVDAAAVPAALVSVTVKAAIPFAAGNAAAGLVSARAAAWTEGVLNAMLLTRLTCSTAVVLLAAVVLTTAGLLTRPLAAGPRQPRAEAERRAPEPRAERPAGREPARPEVRGVVKAVDTNKGTLTVAVGVGRGEEGVEKTFAVPGTAEVAINVGSGRRGSYRGGKLADLAPGALVVLQLAADQKTVEFVLAEGPTVQGRLDSVDAGKNSLTLTIRSGGRERGEEPQQEKRTYVLARNAEVAVDDGRGKVFSLREAKLAELPAGAVVGLKLSVDVQHVQSLVAEGPTVQGVVKTVDADRNQITVTTRAGRGDEAGEEQTYALAAGIDVLLDDGKGRRFSLREGKLADLRPGAIATLKLSVDQRTVMTIRAEGPSVQGTLKAVDSARGTITLDLRAGRGDTPEEKTFAVARDARVFIDGREGKLADVKAEENSPVALKLSLDQKMVQSITIGDGRSR